MHYSDEIDDILKKELNYLIFLKKQNQGPFVPDTINEYYEIYQKILNS